MFRPERMSRALVVGPREKLSPAIEILHSMQLLHVVDYHDKEEPFGLGRPLPHAAELSETLVKLRSISTILNVEGPPEAKEAVGLEDLRQKVLALELNIREEDEARKKTESLLGDLDRKIEALRPFAAIGLPMEVYRGYDTLAVLVGRVATEPANLSSEMSDAEIFTGPGVVAVFISKPRVEEALEVLGRIGFSQLDIPPVDGDPKEALVAARADREKWAARLKELEGRLEKLREKYAGFVIAAQEALEVEVEKAEAPLRFAVSDHSFIIDGWVPGAKAKTLVSRVSALGVFVEVENAPHENSEEPPVLLKNPTPVRPFEFLIHMYSTPSYHEVDPTLYLAIAFPFFFGFMIGDAGYGLLFTITGMIAAVKLPRESAFRKLLLVIGAGGFWSFLFGLLVFGEAFGLPFHPAPGHIEELSWETLGVQVPIEAIIHKAFDISTMVYLSILFAAMHLSAGLVIGFVNEIRHSKKHAIAKLGWLLCVFGLFTLLTRTLSWNGVAKWVWENPLGWFPRGHDPLGISQFVSKSVGLTIPFASFALILCALLALGESILAPVEIAGLLANIMSYTRLAGVAVGKAAIAAAFNTLILENLILPGELGYLIMGIVFLFLAQLLVFLLGGISAGIQALRLNYVEAFIKFFKGNGTPFRPFGMRATQEV